MVSFFLLHAFYANINTIHSFRFNLAYFVDLDDCRSVRTTGGMVRCVCGSRIGVVKLSPSDTTSLLSFVRPALVKPDDDAVSLSQKRCVRSLLKRNKNYEVKKKRKTIACSTSKYSIPSTSKASSNQNSLSTHRNVILEKNKDYSLSCAIEFLQSRNEHIDGNINLEEMDHEPTLEAPKNLPDRPLGTNTQYFEPVEGNLIHNY